MTELLPSVGLVIPTWNGWGNINQCLATVAKQTYAGPSRIVVVDNGSTDGTPQKLAEHWPQAELIRFEQNAGFTGACNAGMQRALERDCALVILVNNDTLLDPAMVERLVKAAAEHPRAVLFNPLICFADLPDVVWANGNTLSLFSAVGEGNDMHRNRHDVAREGIKPVAAATGCIFMARASALRQLGLLLDQLFIYYEDADWSLRAREAGYEILAVPDALAWHKVSADTRKQVDYSAWTYYYNIRNRLTMIQRHGRWYHKAVFYPRFAAWTLYKLTGLAVMQRWSKFNGIKDGLRDFARGHYPSVKYEPHG